MIIRKITPKDFATCIEMGGRMHEESEFGCLEYCPDKCLIWANEIVINSKMVWIVAEHEGQIVGMLGAEIAQPYFSNDIIDSYLLMFKEVYDYYKATIGAKNLLNVLEQSLYLKIDPQLSRYTGVKDKRNIPYKVDIVLHFPYHHLP